LCIFCRFDEEADPIDIVRYLLPDILISILSGFLIVMIVHTQFPKNNNSESGHQLASNNPSINNSESDKLLAFTNESDVPDNDTINNSESTRQLVSDGLPKSKQDKQSTMLFSFTQLPFYVLLLLLCGISVASVLNFPYFVLLIYFSVCWTLFGNHVDYHHTIKVKYIAFVMIMYTFTHLVLLYLYQLQSVQDMIPRPSVTAR